MRRLSVLVTLLALAGASPASAQFAVIDPAQIVQLVKMGVLVETTIAKLDEEVVTLERMRTALPAMARYRLAGVPIGLYRPGAYPYAGDVLRGMNTGGDPDGNAYQQIVQEMQQAVGLLARLDPATRRYVTAHTSTIELLDSTAILGQWTAGQTRAYSGQLQTRIDQLQADAIDGVHEPTANLDRLAIAGTLRSRQQMAATQLQSALVDQMIAAQKSKRDAETELLNAQIAAIRDGGQVSHASVHGTADILANWNLP